MLSYLHKVQHGADIYFFANSTGDPVDLHVRLRGRIVPQQWDPHRGTIAPIAYTYVQQDGVEMTRVRLALERARSTFLVDAKLSGTPPNDDRQK